MFGGYLYKMSVLGLHHPTEIERLESRIEEHTKPIDYQDKQNNTRIMSDITKLDTELTKFNNTGVKEPLFQQLFEMMKTSILHFQYVLDTTGSRDEDLNTSLKRIFEINSKWYSSSDLNCEYDDSKDMKNEFDRLSACLRKVIIPSILSLEFFLYVCRRIVDLIGGLTPELDESEKHKILLIVSILGSSARHADNTGLLSAGVELNRIEILTPEDLTRVRAVKNDIVRIHKANIRNSTGQLQITLSLSSAIGYLCEEIIKAHIPSAITGETQEDSLSPPRATGEIVVSRIYTQQFLNVSPVAIEIAKKNGWCPFIFKNHGCYDSSIVHNGQYRHPENYIRRTRCFYDIQIQKAVMIDPRAWSDLYKFTPRPKPINSVRVHPYQKKGGRNYHNISRRLKNQHQSIRRIHHDLKNYSRSRKLYITKRTRTRTHRRTCTTRRRR